MLATISYSQVCVKDMLFRDLNTKSLFHCSREKNRLFQPTTLVTAAYKEQWISPTDVAKDYVAGAAEIAEKSDDFTHAESHISNSICLRLPGRRRTIERKTIILPRTNEDEAGVELAGDDRGRKGCSE